MNKFIFIIFLLFISCSPNKNGYNGKISFNNEMSFNEFKSKLKDYSKNKSYPNIDN